MVVSSKFVKLMCLLCIFLFIVFLEYSMKHLTIKYMYNIIPSLPILAYLCMSALVYLENMGPLSVF